MFEFCFESNFRALLYKSLLVLNSCNVVVPRNLRLSITSQTIDLLNTLAEQLPTDALYLNNEVTYLLVRTFEMSCSRISNVICAKFK